MAGFDARRAGQVGRFLRLALLAYGAGTGWMCLLLALGHVRPAWRLAALTEEALAGGLAAVLLGAAFLALAALAACGTGRAAAVLGLAPALTAVLLHPSGSIFEAEPADAYLLAGLAVALAFPALVAERMAAAFPARLLAEAAALRRIMLLSMLAFLLGGILEALRGARVAWVWLPMCCLPVVLAAVGVEIAGRVLARWVLPSRAAPAMPVDSLLARLLTGATAPGRQIRDSFGLDFSRSWALRFLRSALVPALLLTVLFCYGLSGVSIVGLDERGVYKRLGAPAAVFGPGLHIGLPWPLGRVRRAEFGIIHETASAGDPASSGPAATAGDTEGPAPASADRLWDQPHPSEANYLIASASARAQNFQTVSADVRVLWRIGLTDEAARRSVYGAADPDVLVREAAGRLMARLFARRTLEAALGERREALAGDLRQALADDLDRANAGIEVLAVVIEAIHPPLGAASAYHAVQAAQVTTETAIAVERGRARGSASAAQRRATDLLDAADADAAETEQSAVADVRRFDADRAADATAGQAFVLERYLDDVTRALSPAKLTVIDSRLEAAGGPVVDLRPPAAAAGAAGLLRRN